MNNPTTDTTNTATDAVAAAAAAWKAACDYAGVDQELLDNLSTWRRHIHCNPELSYQEHETTDYIEKILTGLGFEVRRFSFGSGLTCDIPAAPRASHLPARRGADARRCRGLREG